MPDDVLVGTHSKQSVAANRNDIDDVVRDHPVYVGHRGGHTGVVNSKAFEIAGVTIDTPDPVGGRFFREDGELTGKVAEHAVDVFFEVGTWPVMDRGVRQKAAEISSQNMAAAGLTSTTDAYGSLDDMIGIIQTSGIKRRRYHRRQEFNLAQRNAVTGFLRIFPGNAVYFFDGLSIDNPV